MRFCRLSLCHEGVLGIGRLVVSLSPDAYFSAKSTSYAVDDIGWDTREMISDLDGSLRSQQFLNSISHEWAQRVEHEKIKFISTSGHVIFCLLYEHYWKRRDLLCDHNDGDLFTCEDLEFMLFLREKIWSFRAKAHVVFHWSLCNNFWTNSVSPNSISSWFYRLHQNLTTQT